MTLNAKQLLKAVLDFQADNNRQVLLNLLVSAGLINVEDVAKYRILPTSSMPPGSTEFAADSLHRYIDSLIQGGHIRILVQSISAFKYNPQAPNYTTQVQYKTAYDTFYAKLVSLPKVDVTAGTDLAA